MKEALHSLATLLDTAENSIRGNLDTQRRGEIGAFAERPVGGVCSLVVAPGEEVPNGSCRPMSKGQRFKRETRHEYCDRF